MKNNYKITEWLKEARFKSINSSIFFTWMLNRKKILIRKLDISENKIIKQSSEILYDNLSIKIPKKDIIFIESPHLDWWLYDWSYIILSPVTKNIPKAIIHELLHALSDNWNWNIWFYHAYNTNNLPWSLINEWFTESQTRKIDKFVPSSLKNEWKNNILEKYEEIQNKHKWIDTLIAKIRKKKLCKNDYIFWFNMLKQAENCEKAYEKEVELINAIIEYGEEKWIKENEILKAYLNSDRQIFEKIFWIELSENILSLKSTEHASRWAELEQVKQARDTLIKIVSAKINNNKNI